MKFEKRKKGKTWHFLNVVNLFEVCLCCLLTKRIFKNIKEKCPDVSSIIHKFKNVKSGHLKNLTWLNFFGFKENINSPDYSKKTHQIYSKPLITSAFCFI